MEWRFEVLESFEQIWKCNYCEMIGKNEYILWAKMVENRNANQRDTNYDSSTTNFRDYFVHKWRELKGSSYFSKKKSRLSAYRKNFYQTSIFMRWKKKKLACRPAYSCERYMPIEVGVRLKNVFWLLFLIEQKRIINQCSEQQIRQLYSLFNI